MLKPLDELANDFDAVIFAGHAFHAHFSHCPRLNDCPECLFLQAEYRACRDRYWKDFDAGSRAA